MLISHGPLRRPGFRALIAATFFGAFNDHLFKMVVSLIAVDTAMRVGGPGAYLSVTAAVFILPYLVFSGYAGFVADAFDKRTVLITAKAAELAVMVLAMLALIERRVDFLIATLSLMAIQSTFYSPAKYGILPEILPPVELPNGNGVLELSRYAAIILGSIAGGVLLAVWPEHTMYIGVVLVAVALVGIVAGLGIEASPRTRKPRRFRLCPWAELVSGLRIIVRDRRLAALVASISWFEFIAGFVMLDLLLVGKETLGLSDASAASIFAFAGIGLGFGSIAAGRISRGESDLRWVPIGALGIALGMIGAGLAGSSKTALAVSVLLTGFSGGLFVVPLNAALQHRTEQSSRGHVLATNNFLNMFGVLLGCGVLWVMRDLCGIPPGEILWITGLGAMAWAGLVAIVLARGGSEVEASAHEPIADGLDF